MIKNFSSDKELLERIIAEQATLIEDLQKGLLKVKNEVSILVGFKWGGFNRLYPYCYNKYI